MFRQNPVVHKTIKLISFELYNNSNAPDNVITSARDTVLDMYTIGIPKASPSGLLSHII